MGRLWLLTASFGAMLDFVVAYGVMPSPDAEHIKEQLAADSHAFHEHHKYQEYEDKSPGHLLSRIQDQIGRRHPNATAEAQKMQHKAFFKKVEQKLIRNAVNNLTSIKTLFPRKVKPSKPAWQKDLDKVDVRWHQQTQELHDEKMVDSETVEISKAVKLDLKTQKRVQPTKRIDEQSTAVWSRRELQRREQEFAKTSN